MIILLINIAQLDLSYAVLAGTGVALFIGWKNIPDKLRIINESAKISRTLLLLQQLYSVGFGGAVLACNGADDCVRSNISFACTA